MTNKFKVGDKVRVCGRVGEVLELSGCDGYKVRVSLLFSPSNTFVFFYFGEEMELVEDTPKKWKDMTPEEKGALLLAYHEGVGVEIYLIDHDWRGWVDARRPIWNGELQYRVKPKPEVETVELFSRPLFGTWYDEREPEHTHKITFQTKDGEPLTDTVKMEKL